MQGLLVKRNCFILIKHMLSTPRTMKQDSVNLNRKVWSYVKLQRQIFFELVHSDHCLFWLLGCYGMMKGSATFSFSQRFVRHYSVPHQGVVLTAKKILDSYLSSSDKLCKITDSKLSVLYTNRTASNALQNFRNMLVITILPGFYAFCVLSFRVGENWFKKFLQNACFDPLDPHRQRARTQ